MFKTTTRALAGLVAAAGIVVAVAACDPIDEAATASNTNAVVAAADTSVVRSLQADEVEFCLTGKTVDVKAVGACLIQPREGRGARHCCGRRWTQRADRVGSRP